MARRVKNKITKEGWSLIVLFVSVIALLTINIQYTKYVDERSNRALKKAMCPIFLISLESIEQRPVELAESEIRLRYIRVLKQLVDDFNCTGESLRK